MKKLLITSALVLSVCGLASAQNATATDMLLPVLPPLMVTGDAKIDVQVRALHQDMEIKIKALRDEYQKKFKALIGERKAMIASTTKEMRQDIKEEKKAIASSTKLIRDEKKAMVASSTADLRQRAPEIRANAKAEVRGTSTVGVSGNNVFGFFRRLLGQE